MQITLDTRNPRRSKPHPLQRRFDKLRNAVERELRHKQKLQLELDNLSTFYRERILPAERELITPLATLAEKLVVFYGRKSLGRRQRDELGEWIMEIVGRVRYLDADTADTLCRRVDQQLADMMGITEEELDARRQEYREAQAAEEEYCDEENVVAGPETEPTPDEFLQDDMFGFDDLQEEDAGDDVRDTDTGVRLMNSEWVRSLFRRTAQVLHPDREPDPLRRRDKEQAMQVLLEARQRDDILTMLQLFSEHCGEDNLSLAEAEMEAACQLMEQRIEALQMEAFSLRHQHPLGQEIVELFLSASKKERENLLGDITGNFANESEMLLDITAEIRNLHILRDFLDAREEARVMSWVSEQMEPRGFDGTPMG